MGQEPACNSKPMVWQSWAGFSTGLFCQGLNWCMQMSLGVDIGPASHDSPEMVTENPREAARPSPEERADPGSALVTLLSGFGMGTASPETSLPSLSLVCPICASCCLGSCPQSSQSGASSSEQGQATTVLLCQQSTFGWDSATAAVPRQSRWEMPNLALLEERCSRSAHPEESQNVLSWKGPTRALHRHLNNPSQCLRTLSRYSWSSGGLGALWSCREVLVWFYSKWVIKALCLSTGASQEQMPPASVPGCRAVSGNCSPQGKWKEWAGPFAVSWRVFFPLQKQHIFQGGWLV